AHVAAGPDALAAVDQRPPRRELPAIDDEQLDAAGTVVDAGGQAVAAAAVVAVLPAPLVGPGQVDAGQHVVLAEARVVARHGRGRRSEEHTSELQSRENLVCRLLLEKKKKESTNM